MNQTAVSEQPANPGPRQSSPPPSSQEFKYRNIQFILKAAPLAMPLFSPTIEAGVHRQMAAQVLDALFEHRLDLLSLFTDDEQIRQIFKRKNQRAAACTIRLYGLMLSLDEIERLDDPMRSTLLRILKTVESEYPDLINSEEITDLKAKIASP